MTIRRFLAMLFAVAIMAAPLGVPAMAEARTAPAEAHHGARAGPAHCDEQPAPDQPKKAADKSCCAAMCVAVVVPQGSGAFAGYHGPSERPAPDQFRLGYLGEIATPPPRRG